jgi:hypothetical protein
MLATIIKNSAVLVKFIAVLGLTLNPAALRHVTNVADALIVASERRKKTLSALHRCLVVPPSDEYALADSFRQSPWAAAEMREKVLGYMLPYALRLAAQLGWEKTIYISLDDSLCEKDAQTTQLEGVDWHHDHNARGKKHQSYKNGSVYVLCRVQIGALAFTVNWRVYLREATVKRLNKGRAKADRLVYRSKVELAQELLTELAAYLPTDWKTYVLFDNWYAATDLIKFIRRQHWHIIGGLKSNRGLNGKQLKQWFAKLRSTPAQRLHVLAADGTRKTYWVHVLTGRLKGLADPVCVLISRRHLRAKRAVYFFTTDLSLAPTRTLEKYGHRWGCEVDNFDLKILLGLADYQVQSLASIERWHAVVFLTLAFLQWRRARLFARHPEAPVPNVAEMIARHRQEHLTAFVKAVAEAALAAGAVRPVLKRFLRWKSPGVGVT